MEEEPMTFLLERELKFANQKNLCVLLDFAKDLSPTVWLESLPCL
jgi:hypothetical protein